MQLLRDNLTLWTSDQPEQGLSIYILKNKLTFTCVYLDMHIYSPTYSYMYKMLYKYINIGDEGDVQVEDL
jgi:hypothetical protein